MARILIVDDDPAIQEILAAYLATEGHTVLSAVSGDAALPLMGSADLAILDWMLPGFSGLEVAAEARARGLELPILMLSARSEEEDKLRGLAIGIDDYVVKPFSPREVLARVRVLLRRVGVRHETRSGELSLDARSRRVTLSGEVIELSRLEYDLLITLAQHPGLVWSRERLLERLWDNSLPGSSRVVDVHITSLRKKLSDDPEHPRYIETVRGVGYRFKDELV
ncbi:response regulator transcription factor [Deinococcus detaillensis]|uniref:Response regulator transcription factor n=1 Tax=Deinococcus detaillensis TaxID=2592048 RepID=A0A553UZ67_9DEIO|nr:response regulator transcription factor [Deinococcus detaillensis]TSA85516.1 response regulator transcription factor [Deinococcus detaillensis]